MKKLERMKKLKEKLRNEEVESVKQGAAEAGLGFVEYELPPDEVDEKEVQRSILTSLWSLIPYTNEWYEAMAAEEEMDNLRKIRVERVKAEDLYTMSKMGRHDEALDSMMSETNYDFFYFNKLKAKMEAEGKFQFIPPKQMNIFADFEKGANRNRLKKAINQVNTFMDVKTTEELVRLANIDSQKSRKFTNDQPCVWRGKNKNGENLKCDNPRMRRPDRKKTIKSGENEGNTDAVAKPVQSSEAEYYQFCCYHLPFCASGNHKSGDNIKIKLPNKEGFCAECFMLKMKKTPPHMTADICPGVVPVTLLGGAKSKKVKSIIADEEENEEKEANNQGRSRNAKKRNPLQCQWTPNPNNEKLRVYECLNERAVDPTTGARLPNCPWHLPKCTRAHPQGTNSVISIPNQFGLCAMHYLAEYGEHPTVHEIPYPGMRARQAKDFWKTFNRHFAVPRAIPPSDILTHEYQPLQQSDDFFERFSKIAKYAVYLRRYYLYSKPAAIKIQATFRMYRVRGSHLSLRDKKMRRLRQEGSIVIQSQMRRFLQTKYMKARRKLYNDSCRVIQRHWRGWLCRRELLIDWAAKRIQRFMKLLHFFKFRDTVIMVMQMRRMFLHRNLAAIFIQRFYRGYEGRVFVFRKRFYNLLSKHSIKRIQRWYRYHSWRRKQKPFIPPDEKWALQQCAKKLSRMILELYLDYQRRRHLLAVMNQKAPSIQRLIRGYLAKSGTKKLRFLRKALRSWMKPHYAVDFMQEFLKHRILDNYLAASKAVVTTPLPPSAEELLAKNKLFLRRFLPKERQANTSEIDKRIFESFLERYYQQCLKLPLTQSEKDSIQKRFKNPVNGTSMFLRLCDEYISHHKQPCRKHCRRICGDCYYYRHCNIANCACVEYVKNLSHRNGICTTCNHPKNLHAIVPLQVKAPVAFTGEKKMPLLDLLAFQSDADMSAPVHAKGVLLESVMLPPLRDDDIRSEQGHRIDKLKRRLKRDHDEQQATNIVTALATCMVEGNEIHDNNKYWQQYSTSAVEPHKTFRPDPNQDSDFAVSSLTNLDMSDTVYEKVQFDLHPPDYQSITYNDFWKIVSQNPNKTIEDYHERFDHNIPVPVISHGKLVYSFEGPQIYYNIINQLIMMGEEDSIHYDHPIFLKLVMDHIQVFERHWRKMVADIRVGKLDPRLPISKESRLVFESSNIPRPVIAEKLDNVFRELGFHKKVLGKDIQIRAYAEKKSNAELGRPLSPPKRKRSLPFVPMEESVLSMSRLPTRASTASHEEDMAMIPSPGQTHIKPWSPDNINRNISTANSFPTSRPPTTASSHQNSPSKRDLLRTLGETFRERKPLLDSIENQPSRPLTSLTHAIDQFTASPSKRRKSHSEIQRPTTHEEVRHASYSITTEPRDKAKYRDVMEFNDDRYVCPFPACGCTFLSKDAAIRHMVSTHEQKTRLAAATPHSDAHLRYYWPRDVPWLTEKRFTEKKLPPGSMRCTFPGCPEIFATKMKLEAHLRLVHMQLHPSAIKHGYVIFDRMLKSVPPDRPIDGFNLEYCQFHAVPTGKCAKCMELENNSGPKPPYQIYDEFFIDLKAKADALTTSGLPQRPMTPNRKIQDKFKLHYNDRSYGVIVIPENQLQHANQVNTEEFRGRPIFLIIDRNRVAWIGVERIYTINELMGNKLIQFQPNITEQYSRYEYFPHRVIQHRAILHSEEAARLPIENDLIQWFPVHCIQRIFPIQYIKGEMVEQIHSSNLVNSGYASHGARGTMKSQISPRKVDMHVGTYFIREE